jgi:hypothetical protein
MFTTQFEAVAHRNGCLEGSQRVKEQLGPGARAVGAEASGCVLSESADVAVVARAAAARRL